MKKFLLIILVFCQVNFAQELKAVVNVNFEQLEPKYKEILQSFGDEVQNYLNNTKFAGDNWEGEPINCNFSIFFTSADNKKYSAQVVVTSTRPVYNSPNNSLMLLVQDANWIFTYEENQPLYFSPSEFHPLVSFLDYYAYIIIGLDMDSYVPQGGTEYYNAASDIAILGSNSAFSKGWALETSSFNKRGLVEDLLRSNFQQFRIDFYDYHYNGLDIISEDRSLAVSNIFKLIKNLEGIYNKISRMNVLMRVFFDAKYKEIYSVLKDSPNKEIFATLKKIDPSHISTYDQGLEN